MTAADRELHELRRDLLLTRAAAERAQLAHQIDRLRTRAAGRRSVAGFALRAILRARRSAPLGLLLTVLRFARRQPWLVSAVVAGAARLRRARALRWLLLAGAIAGAAWWLRRRIQTSANGTDTPPVADTETVGEIQ